jgi:hypothetical protein
MLEAKGLHEKGATKEGIVRATEGTTCVVKKGATSGVIK